MPRWKPIRKTIDPMEVRFHMLRKGIRNSDVAEAFEVTPAAIALALKGKRVRMLHRVAKHVGFRNAAKV